MSEQNRTEEFSVNGDALSSRTKKAKASWNSQSLLA